MQRAKVMGRVRGELRKLVDCDGVALLMTLVVVLLVSDASNGASPTAQSIMRGGTVLN